MRSVSLATALVLLLGSCGSPPKPPTVDAASKRPANTSAAIDLQTCKADLNNTRIRVAESEKLQAVTEAVRGQVAALRQAIAASAAPSVPPAPPGPGNTVFTVYFAFGSTRVVFPLEEQARLVEGARTAPLVMLRARTDGTIDSPAESRIARERAAAVRDYLVTAGVDPSRIRATYQPVGDAAGNTATPDGRSLNRRVEVELYRVLPVVVAASAAGEGSRGRLPGKPEIGGQHGS